MKTIYKGHEIIVEREKCLAGYFLLYYSVFYDGSECESSFEESRETVKNMINIMKQRVDAELAEEVPWGEFEKGENGKLVVIPYE